MADMLEGATARELLQRERRTSNRDRQIKAANQLVNAAPKPSKQKFVRVKKSPIFQKDGSDSTAAAAKGGIM